MINTSIVDYAGEAFEGNPASVWYGVRRLETPHILNRHFELCERVSNSGQLISNEVDDAIFAQARAEIILERPDFSEEKSKLGLQETTCS